MKRYNSGNFFECVGEKLVEVNEEATEYGFENYKFEQTCIEDALIEESIENILLS